MKEQHLEILHSDLETLTQEHDAKLQEISDALQKEIDSEINDIESAMSEPYVPKKRGYFVNAFLALPRTGSASVESTKK
jgi:hypothetical protein